MIIFLFCLLIALWIATLIQTHFFLPCIVALLFTVLIFLVSLKQPKVQLPKTLLASAKGILAVSFWACTSFCLLSYQKSIVCTNCIYNYLKNDNLLNSNIIQNIWTLYPRFVVISGLFILWVIIFSQTLKKGKMND